MSYSVSVAVKEAKTKTRMLAFLHDSYRPWPDILDGEDSHFLGPASIEGKPTHIGFGFENHATPEKVYNFSVLRWVALRTGRRRKQFRQAHFECSVPYYVLGTPGGQGVLPVIPDDPTIHIPPVYRNLVVDRYGLIKSDKTARDLAWQNIPEGTFERVSVTHANQTPEAIREALVQSGIERARIILQFIRAEISRLNALWND